MSKTADLLKRTFTHEETVSGLIAHIQEQNLVINGLRSQVKWASATEQSAALKSAADFLVSRFGPADPDNIDSWPDIEARNLHVRCFLASAIRDEA